MSPLAYQANSRQQHSFRPIHTEKNGKQYALRSSTITISELAALAREYIQLKTRKKLQFQLTNISLKMPGSHQVHT